MGTVLVEITILNLNKFQFLKRYNDVLYCGINRDGVLTEVRVYPPPIVTTDFVYVRLIGDRSIEEKDFGRIQIDRIKEMKKIARNFRKGPYEGNLSGVRFSIVAANNHNAGFGPGTVNIFRQLLGLEEVKWGDEFIESDDLGKDNHESMNKRRTIKTKQIRLSDFLNRLLRGVHYRLL